MRNTRRTVFFLSTILLAVCSASGQSQRKVRQPRSQPSERSSKSSGAPGKFKHREKIETRYDQGTGQTTVQLGPLAIVGAKSYALPRGQEPKVELLVRFSFPAQKLTRAVEKAVLIIVSTPTAEWQVEPGFTPPPAASVDGQTVVLGQMKRSVTGLTERMEIETDRETLLKMTKPLSVQITAGSLLFFLEEPYLEALRDVVHRMQVSN